MPEEWIPEFVFDAKHPLGKVVDIYLNGARVDRVFEARISLKSFEEEAFGELIVDAGVGLSVYTKPRLGNFEYQGIWVKLACGRVRIEVKDASRFAFFKEHGLLTDSRA